MKTWFAGLSSRERIMVLSMTAVVVVFLLYLLIIEPIKNNYESNKKNVAVAIQTVEWMKSASYQIKQLQGDKKTVKEKGKQFVLGVVDRSVRKAGLSSVMKRVQPEGDKGVRVWFENASFDNLMKWLAIVERQHGLVVDEINIEKTDSIGLVNVRVFLD